MKRVPVPQLSVCSRTDTDDPWGRPLILRVLEKWAGRGGLQAWKGQPAFGGGGAPSLQLVLTL